MDKGFTLLGMRQRREGEHLPQPPDAPLVDQGSQRESPEIEKWFNDTELLGNMLKQVENERGVRR
jgi:hypothetical protein